MINLLDDKKIIDFVKQSIKSNNIELEYIFGSDTKEMKKILTKNKFIKLLEYCNREYTIVDINSELDIRYQKDNGTSTTSTTSATRCTIKNLSDIKKYCKTDSLSDIELLFIDKKTIERYDGELKKEYNYRLNLNSEKSSNKNSPEASEFIENIDKNKFYRYKHRTSFITDDLLFRIDLTGVKSNSYNYNTKKPDFYRNFKESKILKNDEVYELEIEYIGNMKCNNILNIQSYLINKNDHLIKSNIYESLIDLNIQNIQNKLSEIGIDEEENLKDIVKDISDDTIKNIVEKFNDVIYDINKFIYDTEYLMKTSEREKILNDYYKLTKSKKFVGPDLITLNIENMDINKPGNIFKNYLVTDKADGERYLLYINDDKHGYLINKNLEIKDSGKIFPTINGQWLIDGEYIQQNKNKEKINLYMIFDVYYATSEYDKPIYTLPFISKKMGGESRNEILDIFKKHIENSKNIAKENLRINLKTYSKGNIIINKKNSSTSIKILQESNKILKNSQIEYKIDGLIYLPADLSVGGNYSNTPVNNISGRWQYNYKWKPPEENTIDFGIRFVKENKRDKIFTYTKTDNDGNITDHQYKKLELIVGYSLKRDKINFKNIDYCMKILENKKHKPKRDDYEFIKFMTPEGNDIETDKGYTNIILQDGKLRCEDMDEIHDFDVVEFRYDPNGENGMIWFPLRIRRDKTPKNPQDFITAANVWQTITNPITDNMIRGKDLDSIKKQIENNSISEDYYIGKSTNLDSLRKLHNFIKYKLIVGIGSSRDKNSQLRRNKNILDTSIGQGGDIQKYLDKSVNCEFLFGLDISPVNEACSRFYGTNSNATGIFLKYNTSENIKSKSDLNIDNHSKNMINILYNIKDAEIDKKYIKISKVYKDLANKKFDIVSSQFSVHYYFKDTETLNGYITNILQNINDGGYFIGTCYDGKRIFDRLNNPKPFEYKVGDNLVYSVKKKYKIENFDFDGTDSNMLGNTIDVYMESIGQFVEEYLVNFEYFVDTMKKYGFEPLKPDMGKFSDVISHSIGSFGETIQNLEKLDKSNSISKYYKESINILKNEKLMELSSMNNYFIFKKI